MTSVKEFQIETAATPDALGRGSFVFTDDYSVFDWGKMPDAIPDKGASLCSMGAFNFERLEAAGIDTHYRGVVDRSGKVVSLEDIDRAPREMAIELTQVPTSPRRDAGYDYDAYHGAAGENYPDPLEVVFRNRVPVGSSLRRRSEPADHGLSTSMPGPTSRSTSPSRSSSSRRSTRSSDRYLDRAEADQIAGRAAIEDLEAIARPGQRAS
ncbi:MAG: phosphoribosylaminoimidazolesuccinocarboxamide synthase [Natrialbaceae archaeon]|nr:phosphoribosylaminoimidazolesuccinocarboxamide synthase [Natrialbaceae archaeon]